MYLNQPISNASTTSQWQRIKQMALFRELHMCVCALRPRIIKLKTNRSQCTTRTLQPIYFIIIFLRTENQKNRSIVVHIRHWQSQDDNDDGGGDDDAKNNIFRKWAQFFTRSYLRFLSKYREYFVKQNKKKLTQQKSVKTTDDFDNSTLLLAISFFFANSASVALNIYLPILLLIPELKYTIEHIQHILFLFLKHVFLFPFFINYIVYTSRYCSAIFAYYTLYVLYMYMRSIAHLCSRACTLTFNATLVSYA